MTGTLEGQREYAQDSSLGRAGNPYRLTDVELDFLELTAKGLDPVAASRSLGISVPRGAQILSVLRDKLSARDDTHLRHLAVSVMRMQPFSRFAVLDC